MPYRLLERLSREQLPIEVCDVDDIHNLLSLTAAGLVVADIPKFILDRNGGKYAAPAIVTSVTSAGLAAIKKRRS